VYGSNTPGVFILGDIMKNGTHSEKVVSDDSWQIQLEHVDIGVRKEKFDVKYAILATE